MVRYRAIGHTTRPLAAAVVGLAAALAAAPSVLAADHPIGAEVLRMKDPGNARKRRILFRATGEPDLIPSIEDDPRASGARLEITGSGAGDGAAGPIVLPPSLWEGLGSPSGSKGYVYEDPDASTGVRRVVFKRTPMGGSLVVRGRGRTWPYRITQPQGAIDVRFAVGDEIYCAQVAGFATNGDGRVVGRDAGAPLSCGDAAAMRCGDGRAEGVEECDDGDNADGDGCSAACQLEDTASACAGVDSVAGTALTTIRVASGLGQPLQVTAPPLDPNRVFVVEQGGTIRILENGVLLPDPFLSISGKVSCCSERGLLGLAFHPDFEQNGRFFLNYTDTNGDTVIARYDVSADPARANPESERILRSIPQPFSNHNGGQVAFGPDGFLYVGMGDGGGGGDPAENAQDDSSLHGKLLRLDVDVEAPPYYAVPPTNPNGAAGDPLGLIWAKGLRNPWRFSFDRVTGDLYIGDVGQSGWEEIDFQPGTSAGGDNYGWDIFEGIGHCHEPEPPASSCPDPNDFILPVIEYANFDNGAAAGEGCSVTGGFVYRGCAMPDLRGTYFYSDFCSAFLRTFRGVVGGVAQDPGDRTAELAPGGGLSIDNVTAFGEDARGELYITDRGGEVFKIVPRE
jgi:cysteine-rich repeat protein